MFRNLIAFFILVVPGIMHGQNQTPSARAAAGCGPANVQFDVETDKSKHDLVQPQSNKALVYVFEQEKRNSDILIIGAATIRTGMDGQWVGANHGSSYFFFAADPGDHHLCSDWQSSWGRISRLGSALSFSAEAGKTYYFVVEVEERQHEGPAVKLTQVDAAQGQFLISSHGLSTSRKKEVVANDTGMTNNNQ